MCVFMLIIVQKFKIMSPKCKFFKPKSSLKEWLFPCTDLLLTDRAICQNQNGFSHTVFFPLQSDSIRASEMPSMWPGNSSHSHFCVVSVMLLLLNLVNLKSGISLLYIFVLYVLNCTRIVTNVVISPQMK